MSELHDELGADRRKRGRFSQAILAGKLVRQSGLTSSILARPAFCGGFGLRSFGYMLRSVVGALAANMMLVRCNFDVPI